LFLPRDDCDRPIASIDELVDAFRGWGKPRDQFRLGTEYEMIGVCVRDPERPQWPAYEGECGIRSILEALAAVGWEPVREGDAIIALKKGGAQVTFEPGGQFEHAIRPLHTAREIELDARAFFDEIAEASRERSLAFLGVGFRPFGRLEDVRWMPKNRYVVMRAYLPTRGSLANEMMGRTATVQVNLDYGDADDAKAKFLCATSVSSLLTAIYANSSIVDGEVADYQSYRAFVWTDMDPDRCGLLPFAFEDGDVFRNYVEWALDVPMTVLYRRGENLHVRGRTFRQFLREGYEEHRATPDDWELHLSTLFPEVRLKRILEIRGCDGGSLGMNVALAPLCRGLLYDEIACREATKLTEGLTFDERIELQHAVARRGLRAQLPRSGHPVRELARDLLRIADDSLHRNAPDERAYLAPIREIVETGRTQADATADLWKQTGGDPRRLIEALAHPGLAGA
jgi:glutamate--cysteine ligase